MDKLISVGYENYINKEKVIAVSGPGSAPVKRLIRDTKAKGMLIDVTEGSRTCSVVVMESGHVILTARTPPTIQKRFNDK